MENLPGDEVLEMGMFEEGYGFYSFECHEISSNVCSVLFCLVFTETDSVTQFFNGTIQPDTTQRNTQLCYRTAESLGGI